MHETLLILDFGSQYTQLIARRLRELNVYCEIHPWNKIPAINGKTKGVILSGSPFSVLQDGSPHPNTSAFKGKLPLLGVCYGAQLLAHDFGGEVMRSNDREYGRANLSFVNSASDLLKGVDGGSQVWMSHADTIKLLPKNSEVICSTTDVEFAGYK